MPAYQGHSHSAGHPLYRKGRLDCGNGNWAWVLGAVFSQTPPYRQSYHTAFYTELQSSCSFKACVPWASPFPHLRIQHSGRPCLSLRGQQTLVLQACSSKGPQTIPLSTPLSSARHPPISAPWLGFLVEVWPHWLKLVSHFWLVSYSTPVSCPASALSLALSNYHPFLSSVLPLSYSFPSFLQCWRNSLAHAEQTLHHCALPLPTAQGFRGSWFLKGLSPGFSLLQLASYTEGWCHNLTSSLKLSSYWYLTSTLVPFILFDFINFSESLEDSCIQLWF